MRSEAIERMERAIGDEHGGGFRPGSFTPEATAALDALLDYLEEQSFPAELIADLRGRRRRMVETFSWCQVHDGNPDDCERKIAWDESCDVVELIDPATVDYEAAARLLRQKQTVARGRFRLDEADAADIVDAALGVGEPVEGNG